MHEHQPLPANEDQQTAEPVEKSASDDVMDILADVEKKFDKLREYQKSQEQELTSLSDRQLALDEAERELDEELGKLVAKQNELEQQQATMREQGEELASQRDEFVTQQGQLQQQRENLEQLERSLSEQREQICDQTEQAERGRSDLQHQQQQWNEQRSKSEQELAAQQEALERRNSELQKQSEEHQHTADTLQQLEQELNEQQTSFARQQQQTLQQQEAAASELQVREQKLDQRETQLQELSSTLEQQQSQLAQLQQQVEQKQHELDERSSELESQQRQLEQQLGEAQQSQQTAAQESEALRQQLAEVEQHAQQCEQQLQEVAAERDVANQRVEELSQHNEQQQVSFNESEKRLATAGEKLHHFAEILNEQAPQLERGAAAMAMIDEQRRRVEKLNKQLAEAKRAGDPEELQRRDRRIGELTEALQQARGQIGGTQEASALQIQIAELSARNEAIAAELDDTKLAAEHAAEELKQLEAHNSSASSPDHHHAVEALNAKHEHALETARSEHEVALKTYRTKRDDQVRSLQEQLSKLQDSLIEAKQRAAGMGDSDASVEAFQSRIAELEAALEKASAFDPAQIDEKLRRKVKRINAAAQHYTRRRKRLRQARELTKQRHRQAVQQIAASQQSGASASREEQQRQVRALELQRLELAEVRDFLAASEKELMRRWARPRAISSIGWMVFLTMVAAVSSWFATDYFFPMPVTATVTVAPQPENPAEFTAENAVLWQQWHAEYLLSGDFRKALARRCTDRNFEPYGNIDELSARLDTDMTLDLSDPKRLTVSLAGLDADQTQLLLDMLVTTLSLESSRHLGRGNATARAVPVDERQEDGRVKYASLLSEPTIAAQIKTSAPIFGGIMGGLLLLMGSIYFMLARSKRVFDDESKVLGGAADDGELLSV